VLPTACLGAAICWLVCFLFAILLLRPWIPGVFCLTPVMPLVHTSGLAHLVAHSLTDSQVSELQLELEEELDEELHEELDEEELK